jgi:hypothetical protein
MRQPTCVPNWKFRRRSSMLHERFVETNRPSSVSAMRSSRPPASPGRRLTFVMRMSGMTFQPEARALPMLRRPMIGAVSRLVR